MTNEANMEPKTSVKTKQEKKPASKGNKKLKIAMAVALFFIGLAAAGYFIYDAFQQQHYRLSSQIKTEQDKAVELENQNKKLASNLDDANKQIKSLKDAIKKSENAEVIIPKLTLKVSGVTRDSRGYGYSGSYKEQDVIVDVTLTNNSSKVAYLSASDFRLKDGDNATVTTTFSASWPPAANKKALKTQSVAPGDTVSGSILFSRVSTGFSGYTLYYLEDVHNVTPEDATYSWYAYPWCEGKEGTGELGC